MPFLLRFLAQRSHYSQDPSGVGQFPAETRHFKMFNLWKVLQIFSLQTHKFRGSFYVTETKACTPPTYVMYSFIHSFYKLAESLLCASHQAWHEKNKALLQRGWYSNRRLGKSIRKSITGGIMRGFPGSSDGKESACNAGDLGSVPGSGRSWVA